MTGLVQTDGYARALIATEPGIDAPTASTRLRGGWNDSGGFWDRQPAVMTVLVVDALALYRQVGNAEVMTARYNGYSKSRQSRTSRFR